jgi:hypothetical protein
MNQISKSYSFFTFFSKTAQNTEKKEIILCVCVVPPPAVMTMMRCESCARLSQIIHDISVVVALFSQYDRNCHVKTGIFVRWSSHHCNKIQILNARGSN